MQAKLPLSTDLIDQLRRAAMAVADLVDTHHLYPRSISVSPTGALIELHPSRRNGRHLHGTVRVREYMAGRRRRTLIAQHPSGCLCRWQEEDL